MLFTGLFCSVVVMKKFSTFLFYDNNIPQAKISTIAGTGQYGDSGDEGPAIRASLQYLNGLAVDRFDNVYIVVSGGKVRLVSKAGIITTFAGTGSWGYGGDGGMATNAQLNQAQAVAVDISRDIVYIAGKAVSPSLSH